MEKEFQIIDEEIENDRRKNKIKELEILLKLLKLEEKIAEGNWIKK